MIGIILTGVFALPPLPASNNPLAPCLDGVTTLSNQVTQIKHCLHSDQPDCFVPLAVDLAIESKSVLNKCYQSDLAKRMDSDFNDTCIRAMGTLADLFFKTLNESDNELRLSSNILLMRRTYRREVKPNCGFLQEDEENEAEEKEVQVNTLNCSKWSLVYSNSVRKFKKHLNESNQNALVEDVVDLINRMPSLLYACGEPGFADLVTNWMPKDCANSLGRLSKDWLLADTSDWVSVLKLMKNVASDFQVAQTTCPYFL